MKDRYGGRRFCFLSMRGMTIVAASFGFSESQAACHSSRRCRPFVFNNLALADSRASPKESRRVGNNYRAGVKTGGVSFLASLRASEPRQSAATAIRRSRSAHVAETPAPVRRGQAAVWDAVHRLPSSPTVDCGPPSVWAFSPRPGREGAGRTFCSRAPKRTWSKYRGSFSDRRPRRRRRLRAAPKEPTRQTCR